MIVIVILWVFLFVGLLYFAAKGSPKWDKYVQKVDENTLSDDEITFRENFKEGRVEVRANGRLLHSNSEYRGAAEWAQKRFNLTDAELYALYDDYKKDYDNYYDS